jgi:hypothetical protein
LDTDNLHKVEDAAYVILLELLAGQLIDLDRDGRVWLLLHFVETALDAGMERLENYRFIRTVGFRSTCVIALVCGWTRSERFKIARRCCAPTHRDDAWKLRSQLTDPLNIFNTEENNHNE